MRSGDVPKRVRRSARRATWSKALFTLITQRAAARQSRTFVDGIYDSMQAYLYLVCLQVKRGDFRPPPQVDSAVVRIEPLNPPPPINFQVVIWSTTETIFLTLLVLGMGWSYTHHVLAEKSNDSSVNESKRRTFDLLRLYLARRAANNEAMIEKDEFKAKIEEVLKESGFAQKRPRSMDIDDFLR